MDAKFEVGTSVKVKKGVKDPDTETYNMTGWQGRISNLIKDEDSGKQLYEIAWDSITLEKMPRRFIDESLEDGCAFEIMVLSENQIEKTSPRDTEKEVEETIVKIEEEYF